MILRVFRGAVDSTDEEALITFVRDTALPSALRIPGLLSFQPAIRRIGSTFEFVLASTWTDFDAMLATRRDLDTPIAMPPGAEHLVGRGHADYYEFVAGNGRGLPLTTARLRLTHVALAPNQEAAYFARSRDLADELLDEAGMVAFLQGRRSIDGRVEAVAISVWEGDDAIDAAVGGAPVGLLDGGSTGTYYAAAPTRETFDALTVAPARGDAPAVLLADDERRYVHVTPAVEHLTGRTVARLRAMRIDDLTAPDLRPGIPEMWATFIADGSMAATFALARPDGSTVDVRFSARARSPWPGVHASVLVPVAAEAEPLIDDALVAAGFVSRIVTPVPQTPVAEPV